MRLKNGGNNFSCLLRQLLIVASIFLNHHFDLSATTKIHPDNIFTLPSTTNAPSTASFRSLLVNSRLNALYVGSRGHLFRLWLYNINDTSSPALHTHRSFSVRADEKEECLRMGNSERECAFWVRQIFLRADGNLLLCSSQSMKPQLGVVDGQSLVDLQEARTQIGICSQHEGLNTTAVYIEDGNPDGVPALYSGIRTGLSLENHLIYRPPLMSADGAREVHPALRTSIYDSNWLNEPQFVGSFSAGPHVFFFFREQLTAAEGGAGGNGGGGSRGEGRGAVVSRVARVCKSDLGGRQVLRQVWTSFVKARLNCSLSDFSFEKIQGVTRVDWPDEASDGASTTTRDSTTFYATFSTAEQTPYRASAICAFSLAKINELFDTGPFLGQQSSSGCWAPVSAEQMLMQNRRPGSCQDDSRLLSDEELHFAKLHLLMADQIQPLGGGPILHRRNTLLTSLLADPSGGVHFRDNKRVRKGEKEEKEERKVLLFVYAPDQNAILKVLHQAASFNSGLGGENALSSSSSSSSSTIAHILAIYELPSPAERIHSMAVLPGEYLYLSSEIKVSQFRIGQCSSYGENCVHCVRDPLCSWSIPRRECFPAEASHASTVGWLTTAKTGGGEGSDDARAESTTTATLRCAKWVKPKEVRVFPGESVHLECPGADLSANSCWWTFNGEMIPNENNAKQVWARDGGILLLNVTESMIGIWACLELSSSHRGSAPVALAEYSLIVDGADCAKPKSVEQFHAVQREWCRRMDSYRSNLSKWQSLYEQQNAEDKNCPMEGGGEQQQQLQQIIENNAR